MNTRPLGPDSLAERIAPLPRPNLRSLVPGTEFLEELPERLSLVLWSACREVQLWAATPASRRAELGNEQGEVWWIAEVVAADVGDVETELLALREVFGAPGSADPVRVALSMRALGLWCERSGYPRSAALLADAGVRATPGDLGAVYQAGRAAKLAGWEPEAEAWFRYGLTVALQRGNGEEKALFLGSLGNYYHRRGNLRLSERLHLRALRAARRTGAVGRQAATLQDLCLLYADRGKLADAEAAAYEAAHLYGPDHPMLPVLLHDLAYAWTTHGRFAAAYPLMEAVMPHLTRPDHRLRVVGNLARAAGGMGDRDRFERAWAEVVEAVRRQEEDPAWADPLADALREAAQGALSLAEPARALWAVDRAEPLAATAARGMDRFQLDAIRAAAKAALDRSAGGRVREAAPPDAGHPVGESLRTAEACVALLSRRGVAA